MRCSASQTAFSKHSFLRGVLHCRPAEAGKWLVCFVLSNGLRASFLTGLKRKQIFSATSSWPHLLAARLSVGFCFLPGVRLDTEGTAPSQRAPRLRALGAPRSLPAPVARASSTRECVGGGREVVQPPTSLQRAGQSGKAAACKSRLRRSGFVFSCICNSPQLLASDSLWVLLYWR